jgi:hypothetical protein
VPLDEAICRRKSAIFWIVLNPTEKHWFRRYVLAILRLRDRILRAWQVCRSVLLSKNRFALNQWTSKRAISGVSWNLTARAGQQVAGFIISIFLARLLVPSDFGVVAMAMVLVNFARLFSEQGFAGALIQKQDLRPAHIHSIFWLNLTIGTGLTLLFWGAAPLLARFYNLPDLTLITQVLAFDFIISSFAIVPRALLQKQLAFKRMAVIEMAVVIVGGLVAIILASLGLGIWSLVFQSLCLSLLTAGGVWSLAGWRPRLIFEKQAVRELFRFSINLFGFNTINFWARNADNVLIGRFLGPVGLGIYDRAYRLMLLPISQICSVLGRVMFPVLSTIQHDPQRIKKIYLEAMGAISLVASPLMFGPPTRLSRPYTGKVDCRGSVDPDLSMVGLLQALMNPTSWIIWCAAELTACLNGLAQLLHIDFRHCRWNMDRHRSCRGHFLHGSEYRNLLSGDGGSGKTGQHKIYRSAASRCRPHRERRRHGRRAVAVKNRLDAGIAGLDRSHFTSFFWRRFIWRDLATVSRSRLP